MKNLDLNDYGVLEMNAGEMRENNGGFIIEFLIGLIVSECLDRNAGKDFRDGYRAGMQ